VKIKVRPEDFQVEELLRLRFARQGRYSICRLEKRNWSTLEVLKHIERKYRLSRLSRAGLKDRCSCSVQYVSVDGRAPKRIDEGTFVLKHIGYSAQPVTRDLLLGNRFRIVIRDLTGREIATAQRNLPAIQADGFPNYHDEQRFGSARPSKGFVARKLIEGDLDAALRLYLATPSANDDAESCRDTEFIARHWGDWASCLKHAKYVMTHKPEFAPVLYFLKRAPDDLEGAVKTVQRDLLELFVTGYQSYLWNETLAELIRDFKLAARAVPYTQGELLFFTGLSDAARQFFARHEIPMASPRTVLSPQPVAKAITAVLAREGIGLQDLKLPLRIEGIYFKPYMRSGVVVPRGLQLSRPEPDELLQGKQKLELTFELPPGSYATILVRRLLLV
jgi:tRNA pseudouridine13 synthase